MKDYYQILEIHPDASLEVMNNAYRALVRKYHPDLYHSSGKNPMNERMQLINEAYNVLSNPQTRANYDRQYRQRGQEPLPAAKRPVRTLRNVLLWGLATFVLLKLLVQPLLANPVLRMVVLAAVFFLFLRLMGRRKSP